MNNKKILIIILSIILLFNNNNKLPFIKNIYLNYDIYFFNNKFNNILNQYIIYIRKNPNKKILLKIDTIGLGNIKYNLYLNKYRMNFVFNNLLAKGIKKNNIKYIICVKKTKFYKVTNYSNKIIITIL